MMREARAWWQTVFENIKLIVWGGGCLALMFALVNQSFRESFIVYSWETDGQIIFSLILYIFVWIYFKEIGLWVLGILSWSLLISGFMKK